MSAPLQLKIEAEHHLRQLLESQGLPQPSAVEYGHWCVRFFFQESKTCVIIDLDPEATDNDSDELEVDR